MYTSCVFRSAVLIVAFPLGVIGEANKRLHTAYLLKESFGQLRDYQTPG